MPKHCGLLRGPSTPVPGAFIDADVVLSGRVARAFLACLAEPSAVAAHPPIRHDASASSWLVQRFYAARAQLPGVMGSPSLRDAVVYGSLVIIGRLLARFGPP